VKNFINHGKISKDIYGDIVPKSMNISSKLADSILYSNIRLIEYQ